MSHFDLIIIGSGSGNSILDERFADWKVALVDKGVGSRESFGGTCLNVGCIPSKMFVHTADVANSPTAGTRLGVDLESRGVDWPAVRDRIFGRIDPIADAGQRFRAEEQPNVRLLRGNARFTGQRRLSVDLPNGAETISADRVVIAAGSRPWLPPIPGLAESGSHTSDSIMRLDRLPERMTILGSGFVAAELAHVFASFGVRVTVVARSGALLRHEDAEVSRRFTELANRTWDVRLNRKTVQAERIGDVVRLSLTGPDGPETVEAEQLLVAVGRIPNADQLEAAVGGVDLTADGRVTVDAHQQTTAEGVWALGDVSSDHQLKHVANHEARIVQHNLLYPNDLMRSDGLAVPHAVFSSPQIAAVGLTEAEAQARDVAYVSAVQEYAGIAYGWAMEDTTGFAKILAEPDTGRLLGAHIIGPQAPTLIQPLIQAIQFGLDARTMAHGQYWIHPAMPELIENALLKLPLG
ncbi:MAG: mycothione reductase [Stackebrandtia sp.]